MSIAIERLGSPEAFSACERLQREIIGAGERQILPAYLLVALQRGSGVVLGAYEIKVEPPQPCGCLVDLPMRYDENIGYFTLFHGVKREVRNRGIGYRLRVAEREACQREGGGLITWMLDPLRSLEAHFAFNKLGAIAVSYERNLYGELSDPANQGLATDRLMVEWWIDSTRVAAVIDGSELPHHFRLGLDRMEVVTKTKLTGKGLRRLVSFEAEPRGEVILVEIPVDLDRLLVRDPALARDWRIKTRDVFEVLLASGYTLSGFVHEAGRSFHLLERGEKEAVLGRAS